MKKIFNQNNNSSEISEENIAEKKKKPFLKCANIISIALVLVLLLIGIFSYNKINLLNGKISSIKNELKITKDLYSDAQSELEKCKDQQTKIDELTSQIDELTEKFNEIQSNYDTLQAENNALKEEKSNLQSENTSLKEEIESSKQQSASTASSSGGGSFQGGADETSKVSAAVWITATGKKYHNKPDCGNSNPNTSRQIPLSEAQAQGYSPCKKCF